MSKIDAFSYKLGAADCFCEMVRAGVKKIALAHPCDTREERDSFLTEYEKLCQEYGVKMYQEDEGFLTDLFPVSLNKDRFNTIFYQDDAVLKAYLDLKAEKKGPRRPGPTPPKSAGTSPGATASSSPTPTRASKGCWPRTGKKSNKEAFPCP